MNSIRYCIDDIEKKGTNIIIVGWAYSEKDKKVNINIKDMDNIDIKVVQRVDIFHAYHQRQEALNSGFKIKIPFTKKVTMIFTTDDEKLVCKFNTKRKPKPQRISKIKILTLHILSIINPIRIIRLLIGIPYKFARFIKFLNKNGINKTLLKIRSKINKRTLDGIGYDNWFRRQLITPKGAEIQKRFKFKYSPKISLVISEINEEGRYIDKLIESILKQTYINWELFIPGKDIQEKKLIEKLKNYSNKENKINIDFETNNVNELLKKTTGDFISLLNSNDLLTIDALFEIVKVINDNSKIDFIYSDEDKINLDGKRCDPHFKPDWSPDTLLSLNYICHLSVLRTKIVNEIGGFTVGLEGAQDHDLFLRFTEKTDRIYHIPKILYHWRMVEGSTSMTISNKSYATDKGKIAIENALKRRKIDARVEKDEVSTYYRVVYNLKKEPKVSIIIPTKDYASTLEKCLKSLYSITSYKNYEVIVVNNNSIEKETFNLFDKYKQKYKNFRVLDANIEFNYSKINNMAVKETDAEYIVLLNNDTEIIQEDWLTIMVGYAMQPHVGAVGPKLLYPDTTVQHAGVILGLGGVASHAYIGSKRNALGMYGRLRVPYDYSAVTAACLVVKKSKFEEVGCLEEDLKVAYNDVDFNIKLLKKGYYNVCLPQVELFHFESKSRGLDTTTEKYKRFLQESDYMYNKWKYEIENDKFYNDNFTKKYWFYLDK